MINRRQQKRRKMEERKRSKKVHQLMLLLFRMSQEGKRTLVRMKPCRWTLQLLTMTMLPWRLGQLLRRAAVKTVTREMINFSHNMIMIKGSICNTLILSIDISPGCM